MSDYWLGVATPFAIIVVAWALGTIFGLISKAFTSRGWFAETGWAPKSRVNFHSRLNVRGKWGIYLGLYRSTSGWGSRWLAIGPLTVGRKSPSLRLLYKPAKGERTE